MILQETGGNRRIPIIIGFPEAQAIECKLQEVATPRPLTHDTMVSALTAFGVSLSEVIIRRLPNGVFAADLVLKDGINTKVIDSRSSDAVALAIRVGAPIYTTSDVLDIAGFTPDDPSPHPQDPETAVTDTQVFAIKNMTDDQLSEAMLSAAENEDYEKAARIKAELDRRTENDHKI